MSYPIASRDISVGIATRCGWTVRGSNPGGGENFRTCPHRSLYPHSLLYSWYLVSFPWVKRPGRGLDRPSLSSDGVEKIVELYLYSHSES